MSRTIDDEPRRPEETETERVAEAESKMPNSGQVENDPDPENEEDAVDPDTSDPADIVKVERVQGMRPA